MTGSTALRPRLARKLRCCNTCGSVTIRPGDRYLTGTVFPGHDTGIADSCGHPVQLAECRSCATRYGRAELLEALNA